MSETLNPILEDLARQIAEAVLKEVRSNPPSDSPWLSEEKAAAYIGLKPRSMQNHRRQGTGPNFHKPGGLVKYHRDDLDAYMRSGEIVPGMAS